MWKSSFFIFLIALFTIQVFVSQEQIIINHNAPEIKFEKEIIDLGTFMQYDDPSSQCEFRALYQYW